MAAGEWAYRPEISRQLAKAELEVVWGGDALASREASYIKINKIIACAGGGDALHLTACPAAILV